MQHNKGIQLFLLWEKKINSCFGVDTLDEQCIYKVCSNVADQLRKYRRLYQKKAMTIMETPHQSTRHKIYVEKLKQAKFSVEGRRADKFRFIETDECEKKCASP